MRNRISNHQFGSAQTECYGRKGRLETLFRCCSCLGRCQTTRAAERRRAALSGNLVRLPKAQLTKLNPSRCSDRICGLPSLAILRSRRGICQFNPNEKCSVEFRPRPICDLNLNAASQLSPLRTSFCDVGTIIAVVITRRGLARIRPDTDGIFSRIGLAAHILGTQTPYLSLYRECCQFFGRSGTGIGCGSACSIPNGKAR